MSKAREFEIVLGKNNAILEAGCTGQTFEGEKLHLIEMSAYQALVEEVAELKAKLQNPEDWCSKRECNELVESNIKMFQDELTKLRAEIEILREGLKKLKYDKEYLPNCACHTVVESTFDKADNLKKHSVSQNEQNSENVHNGKQDKKENGG